MVQFPFGEADTQTLSATGDQDLTITNWFTYIDGVTTEATGNRTINVTVGDQIKVGARIVIANKTNGTETMTYGTSITGVVQTGAAGKTHVTEFVYTGSAFVQTGADQQID